MRRGTPLALLALLIALAGCDAPSGERSASTSPSASPTPTLEAMPDYAEALAPACDPEEGKPYDAPAYKGKGPHRVAVMNLGYYGGGGEQEWRLISVKGTGLIAKGKSYRQNPKLVACVQHNGDPRGRDTARECRYNMGNGETATVVYRKADYTITVYELRTRRVVRRFAKVRGEEPDECPIGNSISMGLRRDFRSLAISEGSYARLLRPLINATP